MAGARGSGNKKQGQIDKSQWGPVAFAYANAKENSKLSGTLSEKEYFQSFSDCHCYLIEENSVQEPRRRYSETVTK